MDYEQNTPFIFYLTLGDTLPRSFWIFDRCLKDRGFILVPVKIDQLQTIATTTGQGHIMVLCSITDSRELRHYNERVRGLLKFILKSKRLSFMVLSSFSKANDSKSFTLIKNYFFIKYPINANMLSERIARFHELKNEKTSMWPGGRRAGLGSVTT
jgi:hypothetical protein